MLPHKPSTVRNFTHRASKPKHSKRSDVEFTWTNRPKNETHPGVALHVNWHLKEAYAFASSPCFTCRFYSVLRSHQHNCNSSRGIKEVMAGDLHSVFLVAVWGGGGAEQLTIALPTEWSVLKAGSMS